MVKASKEVYFSTMIRENSNNPKNHLKSLGYSKSKTRNTKPALKIMAVYVMTFGSIARYFNDFFTSIAETLVNRLPSTSNVFIIDSDRVKSYC